MGGTFSAPAFWGTVGYAIACAMVLGLISLSGRLGMLSKDDTGIGHVVITTSFACMWLMWFMAWYHQWHPLMQPGARPS
jgi:hypothetical protein